MTEPDAKLVLLGSSFAGKTCLAERYSQGKFLDGGEHKPTVGAAFFGKKVNVHGREVLLGIWDTAGSERFRTLVPLYYRNAKIAIVCHDLTDRESWETVKYWVDELSKNVQGCSIFIVGTKLDLVESGAKARAVSKGEVESFAETIDGKIFETSSKTGVNIGELFFEAAKTYLENTGHASVREDPDATKPKPTVLPSYVSHTETKPKAKGCCNT